MPSPHGEASITPIETELHYGDTVHFNYTIPANEKDPVALYVRCVQENVVVYAAGGWPIQTEFVLLSQAWAGGAAKGTATLVAFKAGNPSNDKVIADCQFDVLA